MAATIIDSKIFGDIFSDARMRAVWSDENRTAKYLDVERALARVQGELTLAHPQFERAVHHQTCLCAVVHVELAVGAGVDGADEQLEWAAEVR